MSLLSGSLLAGGTEHPQLPEVPSFWFVSVSTEPGVVLVSKALCWCFGIKPKKVPNVSKLNRNQLKSTEINWNQLKTMELGPHFTCGSPVRLDHDAGASARWQVQGRWLLGSCKEGTASPVGDHSRGVALVVPPIPYICWWIRIMMATLPQLMAHLLPFFMCFFLPFQLSFFFLVGWDWSIYSIYSPTMDFELIHFCSAPFTGMGLDICQFVLESHDWTENPLENQWKSSWINHWNGLEASRCWLRSCGVIRSFWIGCWTLTRTTSQEMPGARSWKAWATAAYASSYMEVS